MWGKKKGSRSSKITRYVVTLTEDTETVILLLDFSQKFLFLLKAWSKLTHSWKFKFLTNYFLSTFIEIVLSTLGYSDL